MRMSIIYRVACATVAVGAAIGIGIGGAPQGRDPGRGAVQADGASVPIPAPHRR